MKKVIIAIALLAVSLSYANAYTTSQLDSANTLAYRGTLMKQQCRGRLLHGLYVVYTVDENRSLIWIVDIIDPRQYTKAVDYLI